MKAPASSRVLADGEGEQGLDFIGKRRPRSAQDNVPATAGRSAFRPCPAASRLGRNRLSRLSLRRYIGSEPVER